MKKIKKHNVLSDNDCYSLDVFLSAWRVVMVTWSFTCIIVQMILAPEDTRNCTTSKLAVSVLLEYDGHYRLQGLLNMGCVSIVTWKW